LTLQIQAVASQSNRNSEIPSFFIFCHSCQKLALLYISWFYFYCINWTLLFASHTLDAVPFSSGVGFLFRDWMIWCVCPFKNGYGAYVDANSVTFTNVPVNRHIGSMDAQFFWRFNRPPNIVILMFTNYFTTLLKIRIYRQKYPSYGC
jgi:hypothetical protein